MRDRLQCPLRRLALFDRVLERRCVAGQQGRDARVEVERKGKRDHEHNDPGDEAQARGLRAKPAGELLSAEGDQEHRERGPRGVGDREHDHPPADALRRRPHRDRREHRPGTGNEDETERRPEDEPSAAGSEPREPGERLLDRLGDPRKQQRRRHDEEQRDRDVPEEVLRQPELIEEPRCKQREDHETRDEAGDDPKRLPSRRAAREQNREYREHARRDRRDHTCEEPDADQNEHTSRVARSD